MEKQTLEVLLNWGGKIGISDSPHISRSSPSCLGHSLFVSEFPDAGGRGLSAARDLRKGELILTVPGTALMSRESVMKKDQKLASAAKRYPHMSSTQVLTVCLLDEVGKGRDSWWAPYLMQLPRTYDILASFTQFEIQALQVGEAIWVAEKDIIKLRSDWEEAKSLMEEIKLRPQLLTFHSWLWASATISSRTLHIPWDDAGCLCPVGDLFNYAAPGGESLFSEDVEDTKRNIDAEQLDGHSQRLTDGGYEEDVGSYCFYARKRYEQGEQVLLGYGTYTNLELLQHYGFLLRANPNDKVTLQLERESHSSRSWPEGSLHIQPDGKPSFALLSALRLWATPSNLRRAVGHLAYSGSQLSIENEITVMNWLVNKCQHILEELPTSAEDDSLLLQLIEKMQNIRSGNQVDKRIQTWESIVAEGKRIPGCRGEFDSFFENHGLRERFVAAEFELSRKSCRSMERWRLAVEWRLGYKRILRDCIAYCSETINCLDSQKHF